MTSEFKNSLIYGLKLNSLNGASFILSKIIRGLVIPKILSPISYGLFSSLSLLTRYLNFFDFGATAYFTKEVAKLDLKHDSLKLQEIAGHTFSLLIFGAFLSSMMLIALGFGYSGENQEFYEVAIFLMVPILQMELMNYASLSNQQSRLSTLIILPQ